MPLYIRDDGVAALAEELAKLTNAPSKTEAVRSALRHEIERRRRSVPLAERLARLQERATRLGLPNPDFDMKRFSDDMWDDA